MKIGQNLGINLSKIDKSKLSKSKKGDTFLNLTCFIDTESQSEYGDNGTITMSQSKEEREAGEKPDIVGNSKVFWTKVDTPRKKKEVVVEEAGFEDSDIPFAQHERGWV